MAEIVTAVANKPVWVDLSTSDLEGSKKFYANLLGWQVEVSPDPQYGGYARAQVGGKDVAGIGPKMAPEAPTAWMLYIGTPDADELARKVVAGGGKVIAAPFDVGDQGRMAAFQDPSGAFISAWQPKTMGGFQTEGAGAYGWAELSARGFAKAIPFYAKAFGWTAKTSEMSTPESPYTEFLAGGESIAGGMEMSSMVPAEVPSYWTVYFNVDDVDGLFRRTIDAGGRELVAPMDFPGGRFAIVSDPQGAVFGLLKMAPR